MVATASGSTGGSGGCTPGAAVTCYDGPTSTQNVGLCRAGLKTCNTDGMTYGACVGQVIPAPENCATPVDEDCDGLAQVCAGELIWALRAGDVQDQRAASIAVDADGNSLITGFFKGVLGFPGGSLTSAGGADAFLVKLDSAGKYVWGKAFGDQGDQHGTSVAVDSAGNVVVTGYFGGAIDLGGGALLSAGGGDVFLAKYGSDGAHVWSKRFGAAGDQWGTSIKTDSGGNVVLAGFLSSVGAIDFGGGTIASPNGTNSFAAKFDPFGTHLWSKGFGDQSGALAYDLAVDVAGNAIVTGQFTGTIDVDSVSVTCAGAGDIFVTKFDPNGVCSWGTAFGDTAAQLGLGVAANAAGEVFVTGEFQGSIDVAADKLTSFGGYDIFLIKLDSTGVEKWGKRFGLSDDQIGVSLAVDSAGALLLTGQLFGTGDFGGNALTSYGASDVLLVKLDSAGNHVWSKHFGDVADLQVGQGIAADAENNILVTGFFGGTVDFGAGPLVSQGGSDIFVAKFSP